MIDVVHFGYEFMVTYLDHEVRRIWHLDHYEPGLARLVLIQNWLPYWQASRLLSEINLIMPDVACTTFLSSASITEIKSHQPTLTFTEVIR